MGGGGGGNPDGKEQHRSRRREIERRGRLWRRRRKASSLPGDDRYFHLTLNNRISLGRHVFRYVNAAFCLSPQEFVCMCVSVVDNEAAESLVAVLKWIRAL